MSRPQRGMALAALAASLPLLAAGCGQTAAPAKQASASPVKTPTSAGPTESADQSWVVLVDTYSGEDGETRQPHLVSFWPATGKIEVANLPRLKVAEASGDERVLLIDASRQWVLGDSRPARADRDRGRVRIYPATGGAPRVVDVRRATGDPRLRTDWVAFDPTTPGLLRVVSGLTVWTVPTTGGQKAHREGVLPQRPNFIFGGGFNKNSGLPYLESISSLRTIPPGNGDLDTRPIERDGGKLLITDNGGYPGLPDPGCDLSEGFADSAGNATIFCLDGTSLVEKTLAAGAKTWVTRTRASSPAIPAEGEPALVLPRTGS